MTNSKVYTKNDLFVWILTFMMLFVIHVLAREGISAQILGTVTVLVLMLTNYKLIIGSFHKRVFAFGFFCLMSVFWAMNYRLTILRTVTIFEVLICMSVLYDYYVKLNDIVVPLKILMFAGYAVVIYTFAFYGFDFLVAVAREGDRVGNDYNNVNTICMFAAYAIIIDVYFNLYRKRSWTLLLALPALLMIAACQSRKALFMVIAGPLFLYVYKNMKNITKDLRPLMKILMAFGVLLFFAFLFSDSGIFSGIIRRMNDMINGLQGSEETDYSTFIRMEMVRIGLDQFTQTPLLGIGIGNSSIICSRELDVNAYFHNNYIELLACGGIVGLFLYYIMFFYALRQLIRYRKKDSLSILLITMIVVTLITDYGAVNYFAKTTYFYLMIYYAFIEQCKIKYGPKRYVPVKMVNNNTSNKSVAFKTVKP